MGARWFLAAGGCTFAHVERAPFVGQGKAVVSQVVLVFICGLATRWRCGFVFSSLICTDLVVAFAAGPAG